MANSRIMLVCKHCGGEFCLGKGYLGDYFTRNDNLHNELNAFYDAHGQGICSDVADRSDNARDHFVILEEGETLADVAPKSEAEREIFAEIDKTIFADMDFFKELKKKYTEGE